MKILLLITVLAGFLVIGLRADENDPIEDFAKYHMFDLPHSADEQTFPKLSENQVSMIERMGEIRQEYWVAYKKGGADLEAIKLQFASILFYRDVYRMLTDIQSPEARRVQ